MRASRSPASCSASAPGVRRGAGARLFGAGLAVALAGADPAYLDWQLENEQAGWRYHAAEKSFEMAVDGELTLRGRIDRIDRRVDDPAQLCVLDYKTQTVASSKAN